MWEEGKAGWLEVDTVALCGGSVAGEFVWMVDGVDYATTWVEVRAMWGRGQAGTLAALQDMEASLPFSLLGLDSDNGGEFLNYHVLNWLQKRPRPVFMTRSRPYKKDDNAHVEQKNWTHIRQCFGYERHDNPEVVEPMNALVKGAYGQLLNYFHASLKLERKERKAGKVQRIYGAAQTPLARVLASAQVTAQTKQRLRQHKAQLESLCLEAGGGSEPEGDRRHASGASVSRPADGQSAATQREPAPVAAPLRREALARLTAPLRRHRGRRSARGIDSQSRMLERRTVNQNKGHWVTPLLAQRSPLPGNSYFWRTATPPNVESELSYAYLHAVASRAAMACGEGNRHEDNNGVDAGITAWGPFPGGGYLNEVDLKVQLKATVSIPG